MTSPHLPPFMLAGMVGHPSTSRYGLGSSVGLVYRVCALAPNEIPTAALAKSAMTNRLARGMSVSCLSFEAMLADFCTPASGEREQRVSRQPVLAHIVARNRRQRRRNMLSGSSRGEALRGIGRIQQRGDFPP